MQSVSVIVGLACALGPAAAFVPSTTLPIHGSSSYGSRSSPESCLRMGADGLGVGVIGCGRIGDIHASTLAFRTPGAKLIAVSDIFEEAGARVVASTGGNAKFYKDWKEMVNDPEVEAVVIGSPTPFHAEQINECVRLKKHIYCEKPISFDLKVIDDTMQRVDESGVTFFLGFQRRYDDNFKAVREQIASGAIGDVRTFHITSRDPAPPPVAYLKNSGGIFNDMISHDFDMARFLAGDGAEITEVYVNAMAFDPEAKEAGDFDTTTTMVKFSNGVFGTITNSRKCAFGYDQRVEVFGSEGTVDGLNRSPSSITTSTKSGTSAPLPYHFFLDRYANAYVNAMAAFVQVVATPDDKEMLTKLKPAYAEDGRICILIALACQKSVKENRPVTIDEIVQEQYPATTAAVARAPSTRAPLSA